MSGEPYGSETPTGGMIVAPAVPLDDEHARRAFLAHIRHELRTPLNAILGYSEMLLEDLQEEGEPHPLLPALQQIREAGVTLINLVNEGLNTARFEQDHAELNRDDFWTGFQIELNAPLHLVMFNCKLLMEQAPAAGRRDLLGELSRIQAAGEQLLTLAEELHRNSLAEATQRESDGLVAPVSDLIHDLVSAVAPVHASDGRAGQFDGSVLVVDDHATNRDLLSRRLERLGCRVALAEHGLQALQMIQAQPFDLVLLDMMMPELNGYQVLQRLKADPVLRHIPVIMISALDDIDSVVRCIEIGADDYLTKPFNPVLLQARVGACLEKKRLRDREVLYLSQIEEEKRRSDDLLHVILPDEIIEELKTTNMVRPRLYDQVAVLFCDIVGFTPYCETREPEELISQLQELVERYEELTVQYDMQKIKTIGDAYMATAGLLRPIENPVLNCICCGLEMIRTAQELSANWTARVGIHIGPVIAGVVGQKQYLFDLWGDTVNTAARVESHGVNGAVNVSDVAWEQISDRCTGYSLGLIPVKGKGEMELFRVDCVSPPYAG